jgi:hypothetical protein
MILILRQLSCSPDATEASAWGVWYGTYAKSRTRHRSPWPRTGSQAAELLLPQLLPDVVVVTMLAFTVLCGNSDTGRPDAIGAVVTNEILITAL